MRRIRPWPLGIQQTGQRVQGRGVPIGIGHWQAIGAQPGDIGQGLVIRRCMATQEPFATQAGQLGAQPRQGGQQAGVIVRQSARR